MKVSKLIFIEKNKGVITTLNTYHKNFGLPYNPEESRRVECHIEKLSISPGSYYLGIQLLDLVKRKVLYDNEAFYQFEIINGDFFNTGKLPGLKNLGKVITEHNWNTMN